MYLDLRHLGAEKLADRLPGTRDLSIHFEGVDPVYEPIPIQPCQHYSMGGIDTDVDGKTMLPNFWAAGECACVSVHGANRLGGNSLLETIVFGKRAGASAVEHLQAGGVTGEAAARAASGKATAALEAEVAGVASRPGTEDAYAIRTEMTDTMRYHFGIYRDGERMQEGIDKLSRLRRRLKSAKVRYTGSVWNLDMMRTMELEGMLDVAMATALGAIERAGVARLARAHRLPGARRRRTGCTTRCRTTAATSCRSWSAGQSRWVSSSLRRGSTDARHHLPHPAQ